MCSPNHDVQCSFFFYIESLWVYSCELLYNYVQFLIINHIVQIKLDYPHEVLTCIYGYFNTCVEEGARVLRSITLVSSRGKYGPFGDEIGSYFTSATTQGKVVGFHGRSSLYLDAIGVHMQHWLGDVKTTSASNSKYYISKYLF